MLRVVPLTLKQANALVKEWHRHHKPAQGHRFSIGLVDTSSKKFCGAAIVGRPVARAVNQYLVAEVTRLVTDGTRNACSKLYSAAAACKAMGFEKIQTYILQEELGTSLKASGWTFEAETAGGSWNHGERKGKRRTDQPEGKKSRWSKRLQ